MTSHPTLSPLAARTLLLAAQGLLQPLPRPAAKEDVLHAIRRMGALQIDTIHVVARSPYLVLFSRLGNYEPNWLDELLAEGRLFEYWSHAACFLPIEDYPLYRRQMLDNMRGYYRDDWAERNSAAIQQVLEHIHNNGAVRSADFERTDGQKGTWWNWKEEKQALEYLHTSGTLMIARRERFQRVYDLRERVLPGWDDSRVPSDEEMRDELTVRTVRLLGVTPARWAHDYFRLRKTGMPARLERLAEAGQLERVSVEGWDTPWYLHPDNRSLLEAVVTGELRATHSTLLSPFDPITWDRERARVLFGFDYTIECYLPENKRRYGYFSLPILIRGDLVGRLDAKAHRKEGVFEIRALHLEPRVSLTEELAAELAGAVQRCADWHATPQVVIRASDPPAAARAVTAYLKVNTD